MRKHLKNLREGWNRFFLAPSDGKALSAIRIVLGAAMLVEALVLWPYINDLFGPMGYLQSHLLDFLTGPTIPGLAIKHGVPVSSYLVFLKTAYAAHVVFLVFFVLGKHTRVMTVGVWLTKAFLVNSGNYSSYGVDSYFHNIAFLLALFPCGRHWSLDSLAGKQGEIFQSSHTLGLRMVQIFLLMTYINAGVGKGVGAQWWSGEAIWGSMNLPEFSHFGSFAWMAQYPWVPRLIGWGTVLFEALYFVGVWIPRVGKLWVLAIAGMHLGIALFMGMHQFGLSLAAINIVVFLEPWKLASSVRFPAFAGPVQIASKLNLLTSLPKQR